MTEPPLSLTAFAARQQQQQQQQQQQPPPPPPPPPQQQQHQHLHHTLPGTLAPPVRYPPRLIDPPGLDGPADEEDDGEIICICAYNWDDGYTIQCETCNRWNHMECYYPNEADRPGPDQTHYCVECQPREVDTRRASALQREKYNDQLKENGSKRPVSKAGRKKAKESPQTNAAVNGWHADKLAQLNGRDRKSASPRDHPPPAKRTKISHRSSTASNNTTTTTGGRKRNGSSLHQQQRSPSKSPGPDTVYGPVIPVCSEEFMRLPGLVRNHRETDTNIWNSIDVTNSLSDWLKDPEAVEKDCGQKQIDVFKRWDGPFDEMPGKPEVSTQTRFDNNFLGNGEQITYPCLTVEQDITQQTFIGELLGHVGFKNEYIEDPDSRWASLRHCEPFVFFHPKLPIYIDARNEGSVYRYVRRSCRPNAEMQTIITDGTTYHFCFMATKDITPGEEITVGWEFDDRIRAIYAQRSNMGGDGWAPDVRDQIASWVSNVLANCGPCACSGQGCPMAFFDRRGQAIPIQPAPAPAQSAAPLPKPPKSRKRKTAHNISPNQSRRNSHSRSGSEARKPEADEDMTDSRSVSGSYRGGSGSRDITPSTHYSAVVPELSEREKKKLMREEEMFKKQEEEKGRQKKKRNSSGSNLNTPSVNASSVCCEQAMVSSMHPLTTVPQRQLGQYPNSKYADAATSSRNLTSTSSRHQASSKRGPKQSASSRSSTKPSSRIPQRPIYVDMAVQCDMDNEESAAAPSLVTPPKRKQYLSVTQRLLRRCASNNFKRKAESNEQEEEPKDDPVPPPQGDTMDIDEDGSPKAEADTADVLPPSPVSDKVKEAVVIEAGEQQARALSPVFGNHDSEMRDAEAAKDRASSPVNEAPPSLKSSNASPNLERARLTSHPPMDPPPPPWSTKSPNDSPRATRLEGQPQEKASPTGSRPDLHVPIPASPANPFGASGTVSQSPSILTNNLTPTSIFPPSVNAAVNPSPIARKKMSLSDYTKRSKTQVHTKPDSSGGLSARESSPAISVVSADLAPIKDAAAVSVSPAPESIPASSGEIGRAVTPASVVQEQKPELPVEDDDREEGEVDDVPYFPSVAPVAHMAPVPQKAPVAPMAPTAEMGVTARQANHVLNAAGTVTAASASAPAPAPTAPM